MMEGGMKAMGHRDGGQEIVEGGEQTKGITDDDAAPRLMTGIEQSSGHESQQVYMEATQDGIRIQIVDTVENPIFPPGGAQLTDGGKKMLRSIAGILRNFPNDLAVEGHTDGSTVRSDQVSNWDLSAARALFARRELESDGIDPSRIVRVVGNADKTPLMRENLEAPRNRRISILFIKGKKMKMPERLDWLIKPPT